MATSLLITKAQAASLAFAFKNPDGSNYSLSGCSVVLDVRHSREGAEVLNRMGSLSGNVATFALSSSDTDIDIRAYAATLTLTDAAHLAHISKVFFMTVTAAIVGDSTADITVGDNSVDIAIDVEQPTNAVDKYYRLDFPVSTSVTVNHDLNKRPSVTVVDSAGDEVEVDVQHINDNQCILSIAGGFSGSVFCN